ncbi:MAG: helicase HerA-like domain-containing protein [Hyphomicrobium sp.]|nr:helicase HerA-like domain-containing protein [Hyphomicrobium sp.]
MTTSVLQDGKIFVGKSVKPEYLDLKLANRHGLITGATGTGKTVTLQILAEGFSAVGVPVFAADIKGDLSGIAAVGEPKDFLVKRAAEIGLGDDYKNRASPTILWDVFGEQGHPIRATVQDMGPLLLSRLLELNEVQEGVLNIAFRVAADEKMPLLDLKDLRALMNNIAERAKEIGAKYGNVATTSIGSIQRRFLVLEEQGANQFFGEPALDLQDFLRIAPDGRGVINLLSADRLMQSPRLYATFLLWMLTKLWQTLPEVGDQPKPKLVFFFDEAHLLFDEAPKALLERIEQVARLIRSKGVGVYFITQNPMDVPNSVSAQLGNRVQHALRAFTPQEQKAVKAAATTFRKNPDLDTEKVIMELKVGEALVSMLENKGEPSIVQRTLIRPPEGRLGPVTADERQSLIEYSPIFGKYEEAVDRESAHEILTKRTDAAAQEANSGQGGTWTDVIFGGGSSSGGTGKTGGRKTQTMAEQVGKELQRTVSRSIATSIKNIIVGAIKGGRR